MDADRNNGIKPDSLVICPPMGMYLGKRYEILYIDPPWQYSNTGINGACQKHYETMTVEQLKAMDVAVLARPQCALFLWTTYPMIPEALELIKAWHFVYKTVAFTWVKKTVNGKYHVGMGFHTRSNPEICLLAFRGKELQPIHHDVRNLVVTTLGKHSTKPARIRDDIVRLYGDRPRAELFAREQVDGWDAWGNELKAPTTLKEL